jgi:hypothetical protein
MFGRGRSPGVERSEDLAVEFAVALETPSAQHLSFWN